MSNPSQSLSSLLTWNEVLPAIGIDGPRRFDLPQSMDCPLCERGVFTVMRDNVLHSQWVYCHLCRFAGDLIELAAQAQKLSLLDAIASLEAKSLFSRQINDNDVTHYTEEHLAYRRRINAFWDSARNAPLRPGGLGPTGYSRLRRLFLADNAFHTEWPRLEGRLFGLASREAVEELLFPRSFEVQERLNRNGMYTFRRGGGPGKRRLFPRQDWDQVVVIPHFDLPGRIIGFSFVGGDMDNPEFVYKRANIGSCAAHPRESGLAFLQSIDEPTLPALRDAAFLFVDPMVATLLHARHLRESQSPLPILLAKQSRDFRPLNFPPNLQGRELILCGPPMETLPLAKAANAKVSLFQITDAEVRDKLKRRWPRQWLHFYRRDAVSWITALSQQTTTLPRPELEILLRRMNLSAHETRRVAEGMEVQAGQQFVRVGTHHIGGKSISIRGQTIFERDTGWSIKKSGKDVVICNWPVRIECIHLLGSGSRQYEVSVHFGGEPVKLLVTDEDLQHSTLVGFVSYALSHTTNPQLHYAHGKWAKESFNIAMQFSDPPVITLSNRIGWDPHRLRFQFPSFSILNNGVVDPQPMPIRHLDPQCPAAELTAPMPQRESVTLLSRNSPATQVTWALAACIAHNLLAGNGLREPLGVILDGQFARDTGLAAAMALGCGLVDVTHRSKVKILNYVSNRCGNHDFPCAVQFGKTSKYQISPSWLDDPHLRRAVLPLPPIAALAVSSHAGFVRVCGDGDPQPLGQLRSAAPWIIPSYLEDLCRRRKQFRTEDKNHDLLTVLSDMAEWFEGLGGSPKVVLAAQKMLMFDSCSMALAFVELTEQLREAKEISFSSPGGPTTHAVRAPLAVIEHPAAGELPSVVQVKLGTINDVLRQKHVPTLDPGDVQADLVENSAWSGTVPTEDGEDWLINAEWWQQQIRMIRLKRRPKTAPNAAKNP